MILHLEVKKESVVGHTYIEESTVEDLIAAVPISLSILVKEIERRIEQQRLVPR